MIEAICLELFTDTLDSKYGPDLHWTYTMKPQYSITFDVSTADAQYKTYTASPIGYTTTNAEVVCDELGIAASLQGDELRLTRQFDYYHVSESISVIGLTPEMILEVVDKLVTTTLPQCVDKWDASSKYTVEEGISE